MAASKERAVGGVTSGLIGPGQQVSWEARHLGRLWRMTSEITEFDRPHRFVDKMVRGPFASFRHEHRFDAVTDATRMTDTIDVRMGLGPAGPLADAVATAYLRRLIATRNATIRTHAERA
jgi:ligand-binding SRPBCC domain-containing protein